MNVAKYLKHECGYIEQTSMNNEAFHFDFTRYCSRCGKQWRYDNTSILIGYYKWTGKLLNPLTWFNYKFIETE